MRKKGSKARRVTIEFKPEIYARLEKKMKETTCTAMADYLRRRILRQVILKRVRNESIDDLLYSLIAIKNQLEGIQAGLREIIAGFQTHPPGSPVSEVLEFLLTEEFDWKQKLAAVHSTLINIYEQCTRK